MLLRMLARFLALLLLTPALLAQPLFFGDPVPQTHTRYGTTGAQPKLVTNGRDFLLFWATDSKVRVTRLVEGQKRAGRPVLNADGGRFDVVWTGTHFLVAGYRRGLNGTEEIRGRMLNANGEPMNVPFTIVPEGGTPQLAFDGARVLMVYGAGEGEGQSSILLRPDGTQATEPRLQMIAPPQVLAGAVGVGGTGFVAAAAQADRVRITLLLPTGAIADVSQVALSTAQRRVAIASNGADVLVVWTNGSAAAELVTVHTDGTIDTRTSIVSLAGAADIAVAWNGTNWLVSAITNGRLRTHFIDGETNPEVHPSIRTHDASPVSLASLNGRTLAAWRGNGSGQPVFVRDLAASGNGAEATFAAAEQTLHTATSAYEAALAVWSEWRDGKRTLHAGVRTTAGSWRENRIGTDEEALLASSDGNLFLVVRKTASGWSAVTLSDTAEILASTPVVTTFTPSGITWDGGGWTIIGASAQSNLFAVRVMPWGAVSAPVLIEEHAENRVLDHARIAAGGGGFFAVWQEIDGETSVLRGTRLLPSLQRVDTGDIEVAAHEAVSPDLYWDGNRFVVFWLDNSLNQGALETRSFRPDAAGSGTTRIAGAQIDTRTMRATLSALGTLITSNDGEALLIRSGDLITRYPLGFPDSPDAVVNLGADVAYLQAFVRDEMPYHGASHIFLRTGGVVARDTPPLAPQIVRASMTDSGNLIVLQWTPPIDAINGYRIEYRVDDGTWNELDAWIDDGTTSVSIEPWLEKVQYHFRIRAWSDAGVSEYSLPATVRLLGRRRAVR